MVEEFVVQQRRRFYPDKYARRCRFAAWSRDDSSLLLIFWVFRTSEYWLTQEPHQENDDDVNHDCAPSDSGNIRKSPSRSVEGRSVCRVPGSANFPGHVNERAGWRLPLVEGRARSTNSTRGKAFPG